VEDLTVVVEGAVEDWVRNVVPGELHVPLQAPRQSWDAFVSACLKTVLRYIQQELFDL